MPLLFVYGSKSHTLLLIIKNFASKIGSIIIMSPNSPHTLIISILIISISVSASSTDFVFNTNFSSTEILLFGNATIESKSSVLILTKNTPFTIGRALYPSKIPIRFTDSSFSFATSFIFSVAPQPNLLPGHGFAFLFTPTTGINGTSSAQHLGLLNFTNNGSPSNHVFAVEFDSFQNQEFNDTNNNHVGVDLNSLVSTVSSEAGFWGGEDEDEFKGLKINNGETYQVWIECLHSLVNITMAEVGEKKPRRPLITHFVNFSGLLLDEMYVGFTAATGQLVQSHRILSWSFSTTNLSIADALLTTNLPSFAPPKNSIFNSKAFIVGITVGCGGLVIIFCIVIYVVIIIRRGRKKPEDEEIEDWELEYWPHRFTYGDVYEATDGFSEANVIGFGRNGKVYKGSLGRSKVAVKRISVEAECGMREFVAEISSLGRLKHRNLVKLIGWCKKEKGSLILMYDYMENGSLDKKLFECEEESAILSWERRMRVLKDVATGLLYLHEGWDYKVLHRDIKANNVLLDKDMNARLGDFGLARIHTHKQKADTTQVVGTVGYMAPEVVRTGRVSTQADVFAFGVLVLEVVCGRRATEEGKPWLMDWVKGVMEKGELKLAVDERLKGENGGFVKIDEVEKMVCLGLLCSHPEAGARPTMQQIVNILDERNKNSSNDGLLNRLRSTRILSEIYQGSNFQQHPTFEEIKNYSSSTSLSESDILKIGR